MTGGGSKLFDLEDYAGTYEIRNAYLKAANPLQLAAGPYRAARDAWLLCSWLLVVCLVAVRVTAACLDALLLVAVGWDWLLCSWLLRAWLLCSWLLCFLQLTCPRARPTCSMPIVS